MKAINTIILSIILRQIICIAPILDKNLTKQIKVSKLSIDKDESVNTDISKTDNTIHTIDTLNTVNLNSYKSKYILFIYFIYAYTHLYIYFIDWQQDRVLTEAQKIEYTHYLKKMNYMPKNKKSRLLSMLKKKMKQFNKHRNSHKVKFFKDFRRRLNTTMNYNNNNNMQNMYNNNNNNNQNRNVANMQMNMQNNNMNMQIIWIKLNLFVCLLKHTD